jgi:hypothetical protein
MASEQRIDPPDDPRVVLVEPAPAEELPAWERFARKLPNKGLILAVAFGLALLTAGIALLFGLAKL